MIYDPGNGKYIVVDGNIVERDAYRIAERIKEYDEDLDLIVLDPETAGFSSAPFLVVCRQQDGTYTRVLEAWELDERIIQRLWSSDGQHNDQLKILAEMELKRQKKIDDDYKESVGDGLEMGVAALKSDKSTFSFKNKQDDLITLRDDSPYMPDVNHRKKSF